MPVDPSGPAWDGARNLGDLGGLPRHDGGTTRTGRVYRSAAPEWMTDRGWAEARAAGLGTVVDLRNEVERGRADEHPVVSDDAAAGIRVVHAPTEDPDDQQFLAECGPWLDHPRSWEANLRMYPDKIARVLDAVAESTGPVLIHCAGGRDRTGMIGSVLLALAGVTHEAIIANYESGFRGAAGHRGHGLSYDPATGGWVASVDEPWDDDELDAALADRRPALVDWLDSFDADAYVRGAGVAPDAVDRLRTLLAP